MDATRRSQLEQGSLELENGSRIVATSTSSSVRGSTFNIIFLDEFAYVPNSIAEEFLVQFILQYLLVNLLK